jgi:hypothetical protein
MWSSLAVNKDSELVKPINKFNNLSGICECGNKSFKLRIVKSRILRKCQKCHVELDVG